MSLFNIETTDTLIATMFENLAAPAKVTGMDYTQPWFIYDNLSRLYARLYPFMMRDFVHQKDYNTFVKLVKSHKHVVVGHKTALPSTQLTPFRPLTLFILAATVTPEPWTGIPAKTLGGGLVLTPMYQTLRTAAKAALTVDKTKKEYL